MRCLTLFKLLLFELDSPKMILTIGDATETLVLGDHEEDVLNEVSCSASDHLTLCSIKLVRLR